MLDKYNGKKILTIIIPMYQAKPWIQTCLRSLLVRESKRQYLEVLVVNDGSTDGCDKDAWKYAQKYPDMFQVLHKENGGHGSAVNAGIRISTGKYVKVLDADDWMDTAQLEMLLEELGGLGLQDREPDMILCGYQTFHILTGKTERILARMRAPTVGRRIDPQALSRQWGRYRPVCTFHGIAYRTVFYRENCRGLPEHVFYDDAYYAIVPASHAEQIFLSASCPYVYRIGDSGQSVSAQNRVRRLADARRVAWAICATMRQPRPPGGQIYWEYRTQSFLADYLTTCFVRFIDKKAGRAAARRFMNRLQRKYPVLALRMRNKYRILKVLGFLRIGEKQAAWMMRMRRMLKRKSSG